MVRFKTIMFAAFQSEMAEYWRTQRRITATKAIIFRLWGLTLPKRKKELVLKVI